MDSPSTPTETPTFISPSERRPPPELKWTAATIQINPKDLPHLPTIRDRQLARQARCSKDYLTSTRGLSEFEMYDHEVDSYRKLEWLGDGKLHQAYSEGFYKLLPRASPGILSILRDSLETNATQSYIGWAYELDQILLEPPPPPNPKATWRPLSQSQNIVADLFEAHMGALVQEGRSREVDDWVGQLLETISDDLKRKAEELVEEARQKNKVSRGDVRKRSREENVFDGGWEKDPLTKIRRTSLLTECPCEAPSQAPIPRWRWHDRTDADGKWHSHFVSDNTTIACGRGQKIHLAHDAAIVNLFHSLGSNEPLDRHLAALLKSSTPEKIRYRRR